MTQEHRKQTQLLQNKPPPKLSTDEFLLHRSYFEKTRVNKLKQCHDPNKGLTKCLVCAQTTNELTFRCDHCLRLFHRSCWDIPAVPTRLWFCSLKCEEHMLLTGSSSTRLPGVNQHLSSSAIPLGELKLTLMRKRRLENPMKTAAKRAKGGSRSPSSGMEDFDDGDDDSIKTTSSKDGDDTEGCGTTTVKALIERYTTDDVPCYLCGTVGCQGHSPAQVRDKLFARRTRAKRLKELRNQCIQEVQRQRESGKHQMQQRYHRQKPVTKRMPSDPDNNIRRRTEDGILTLVQMFDKVKPDMSSVHKQKVHYNVRIQVTKMVEDVLKEYKTKIELQFQNTYRKQAKNMPLYQQQQKLQQSSYHASHAQTYHQATGRMAYNQSQMQHQHQQAMPYPHATRMSMYQTAASNSPPLPQRNFRQKNAPFTNTPSPSMSPETQTQPSPPYVEANKRRARPSRDTKPIIPMLSRENQQSSRHSAPPTSTCVRENSLEVERTYPVLPVGMDAGKPQSNRFSDIDFVSLDPPSNNERKNDGSRLDVWGSSPLPLPPSNAQTEANLMAHNVHGENNDLLMSSFEVQNGRDLLKN